MAAGILLMDLIWAAGLFGLTLLSASTFLEISGLDPAGDSWSAPFPLRLALGLIAAILAWIAACAFVLLLLPRPRPGKHRLMRGTSFYLWALGFIVRRWIELPPLGLLWRQSGLLRFLVLRASGAKVAFTAQMSSDATVLDPPLLTMGPGAMLGSQSTVAGHFIVGDRLLLAPVVISAGAQIALDVIIGPGTTVGQRAIIEARTVIGPECVIGDGAHVAGGVGMARGVIVGARARIAPASILLTGTVVPDDGVYPPPDPAVPSHVVSRAPTTKDSP